MRLRFWGMSLLMLATDVSAAERIALPDHPTADQRADIEQRLNDWPLLARFAKDNATYPPPRAGEKRVIFFGDSITDFWGRPIGEFFPGRGYINRGISGQTTAQMLVRFRADVIALKPAVVVILAGTNDIAGNTGASSLGMIEDNLSSMTELARAHGIHVVLASLLPVSDAVIKDQTVRRPPSAILALNAWIRQYAGAEHLVLLDYAPAMSDGAGALKVDLTDDGLHPNAKGYAVMAPLAQKAVDAALAAATD
ncbi:MAG: SGNH/GDSL hydrolase family protein [Luteibacter sp.]|nr:MULTISPECIES: SGNH/GDSL hydrolase family protein [unclassified Luteibacter]MDQ7995973.1 SGNH/GDSL hydrolase family protein [Luteibacter sp.]MDQ8048738.1 SGNH/GDSL hydrolase family protein [Luteibacter sp.]SKB80895.1 Lysophospholipase L1 [Luteibacter sp. 22Crub2.1]